jgi:short-subunit dehydrogenase
VRSLKGIRALVTGASSGIGRDIARELAALGADLVIAARGHDALVELKRELESAHNVAVAVVPQDLALPGSPEALFQKIAALRLPIDILVNNAGYGIHQYFADIPWEREAEMIRLLVDNLTQTTKLFLPPMIERGRGWILHTSSVGAFQPTPTYATYSACKSYVMSFSIAIRHELSGTGVRVSVLCPGVTDTGFQKTAGHEKASAFMKASGMTSARVARIAVRGMLRGKALIVPGLFNKVNALLTRFIPRSLAASIASGAMGEPEA